MFGVSLLDVKQNKGETISYNRANQTPKTKQNTEQNSFIDPTVYTYDML